MSLTIHLSTVIERAAVQHPEREAIVCDAKRVTYGELAIATERLAAALGERSGLKPQARIGLIGRNSVEFAVALTALSRFGFTVVPLNWRLAPEALAATAAKYEIRALLYSSDFADEAAAIEAAVPGCRVSLPFDDLEQEITPNDAAVWLQENPYVPAREDLFAIISTGGTSGTPKGVLVTNAMVEAGVINALAADRLTGVDSYMPLPQMFHNPHAYIVPALFVGAKIVMVEMPGFDPELVLQAIESERVTRLLGIATMLNYMADAQEKLHADLSSLQVISYGGAPFAVATIKRLIATFDCDFVQMYGATEASTHITALSAEAHRKALADESSEYLLRAAGKPVWLTSLTIVDEKGDTVPKDRDTIGEICLRGPSITSGYLGEPDKSAEALRDGWLHTGDLGVWDEEGYTYIVDRRGEMIITGGENVYPAAVESVIYEHPAVDSVAVVGKPDPTWGEIVTAVVVLKKGHAVTAEEISEMCGNKLARYMRPRVVEFVDELPKNASGKILRAEVKQRLIRETGDARQIGAV